MDLFERKAAILKALAQPVRLRIVEILRDGERCVCEILPLLGEEQANTSKHLSVLRQAGIVEFRKEGVSSYYRVKDKRVFKILDQVDELVKQEILQSAKIAEKMGISS